MENWQTFEVPEDQRYGAKKTTREACRIVMFGENKLMPLLYVSKDAYHKLPWWWIDENEEKITALKREAMEEAWCEITAIKEVGMVTEKNSTWEQKSYCYTWEITKKHTCNFTEEEMERWFQLKWVTIQEASSLLQSDIPLSVAWERIKKRDWFILETIKNNFVHK